MAKTTKSTRSKKKAATPEVIAPEPADESAAEIAKDSVDTVEAAPIEDAEIVSDDAQSDADAPPKSAAPEAEPEPEAAPEVDDTPSDTLPAPTPEPSQNRTPFVPLVIGGIVAGAIGFAAAFLLMPSDDITAQLETRVDALDDDLVAIQGDVAAFEPADLTPLETALAAQQTTLTALAERITALEARPVGDSGVTVGEMTRLQQALADQQAQSQALTAELERLAAQQDAGLRNAETEALQEARAAEQAAARQVLRAALDSGEPFASVLDTLNPPLSGDLGTIAAEGIPTTDSLTEPFDTLARSALATARAEAAGEGDTGTRLASFLRAQLGARSVEPREGDDPDAVLSRAQFAAQNGDFATALTEIAALPESAQAAFADWIPAATARAQATAAITDYLSANQGQ